jgi:hypothetical protein
MLDTCIIWLGLPRRKHIADLCKGLVGLHRRYALGKNAFHYLPTVRHFRVIGRNAAKEETYPARVAKIAYCRLAARKDNFVRAGQRM